MSLILDIVSFFCVSTLALRGRARAVVVGSCCQHHEEPITPTLPAAGPVRARPAPATASSSRAPPPQPPHPTPVRGAVQRAAPSLRLETHSQAARERSATPPPPREAPFLSPRTGDAGCCPRAGSAAWRSTCAAVLMSRSVSFGWRPATSISPCTVGASRWCLAWPRALRIDSCVFF